MAFFDWVEKRIDRSFERAEKRIDILFERAEKRMDDTFNKISRVVDPDYVDVRTASEINESKERDRARRSIPFSTKNNLLQRTEKEKREDKKDIQDAAYEANENIGNFVSNIFKVGDTIENGMKGINPLNALINELSEEVSNIEKGDHLYIQRVGYTHHGIYVGYESVIHYLSDSVQLDSLEVFKDGSTLKKMYENESPSIYSKEEIVARAYSRISEDNYNLAINNCEHLCRWCRFG